MIRKYLIILTLTLCTSLYAQQTTRFMVVGDPHNYSPMPNFRETVFFEIVMAAIDEEVDFIFFTGDLVIRSFNEFTPIDSALKDWRCVLDTLNSHNIKVFACRGNNDVYSGESWDSLFTSNYGFPINGPEGEENITYALEFNNILILALDQYTLLHRINQNWLDEVLAKNKQPHIFVAAHEPAFKLLHSNCMGAYPEERNIFWESLITAGIKIFFCGHDHFYDHAIIDDGDGNPNNDIHQVIVGTAGYLHSDSEYNGDNGRWTPVRLLHEKINGYVLVEVHDDEVDLKWKRRTEANVFEDGGDSYTFLTTSIKDDPIPAKFKLFQNYPNPFNPSTKIKFQIPNYELTTLKVYNIIGQEIKTLLNKPMPAGYHEIEFNGQNFSSGIYLYRIEAGEWRDTKKMMILH